MPGRPGLYVVGCFDSRITFYSQQVRALELVYALHDQQYLLPNARIAIIGGGACGVTLAAALALSADVTAVLLERSDELLPLQRGSTRRRIDPHIYDWPNDEADHESADLPLLDWRADTASRVRHVVLREFSDVVAEVTPRIEVLLKHNVLTVRTAGDGYEIEFERNANAGEAAVSQNRVTSRMRVNMVMFSFGFGLEPARPLPYVGMESYWSDASVPGPEITGRARPRFFVSGSGDGGLIDLVAAASADFDHTATIKAIVRQPGISEIFERLEAIDVEARRIDSKGQRFDFVTAYDAQIYQDVANLGLVALMRRRLRQGVQLILQTRSKELMPVKTSTLNRLAVYLVIKACEQDDAATFRHVHCSDVALGVQPSAAEPADYWFDCSGEMIGADKAIIRRGPTRMDARRPFEDTLEGFAHHHEEWLKRHSEDAVVPALSEATRAHFDRRCHDHNIPMPRHVQEAMAEHMPWRVKIQRTGSQIHWTGDISPLDAARIWDDILTATFIVCQATPEQLEVAAFALARLAIHAKHAVFFAHVATWRPFLEKFTSESRHAEDLTAPALKAIGTEGSIIHPRNIAPDTLRQQLDTAMDRWMLNAINDHMVGYLQNYRDPGSRIGFSAAPELRKQMRVIWVDWRGRFEANPDLLSRFLRLTVCALDTNEAVDEANVLVGRQTLKAIVRSTAVALAVATGWSVMTPHSDRPGNLTRAHAADAARTGHTCAAARIDGELTALSAAKFMWRTHFVLLPMVNGPSGFAALTDSSLVKTGDEAPRLTDVDEQANIVLTVDEAFVNAVQIGPDALTDLLTAAEGAHFRHLGMAIERANQ